MTVQLRPRAPQDRAARLSWLERHLKWLYWVCAAGLAPWVAYLYLFQIPSGPTHQIHLMTASLILAIIAGLLLTAWTYHQRRPRSVIAASCTATAVFMSVRFRLITGAGGPHWAGSLPVPLALAVTVVMLCALVIRSFWIAARTPGKPRAPLPAAVPRPQSPGTAGLPFFSRLPLIAGTGAITAICGMLDAATFLGLGHVFAETMNGNIIFLAFVVGTHGVQGLTSLLASNELPYAVVLACFAAGAAAGGRLVRRDGETGRRIGFASDAGLIGAAAIAVALTHPGPASQARYLVIGILAVAMGVQNLLIRRWGIPDHATNAMTKTMAYLVADSPLGGGDNHHARRRGTSIVIFAAGAATGAFLIRYGVLWPILTSFTLFVLALPILLRRPASDPAGTQIRPDVCKDIQL